MENKYDVVVIGAGPAGYVAAIRASQNGLRCAIIEKRKTLGGTCLNLGCIPTKALLDSTHKYQEAKEKFSTHGIISSSLQADISVMMQRKNQVVDDVCNGVEFLMKKNKIAVFYGMASFLSAHEILVQQSQEKIILQADNIIIATGSEPVGKNQNFASAFVDEKNIVTSDTAISFDEVPHNLVIVGAGAIGLELGSVWSRLGSQVKVIEMLPRLLPPVDKQVSVFLERSLKSQGMEFFYSHAVEKITKQENSIAIDVTNNKNQEQFSIEADKVLVAVGRRAYTQNLALEKAGVETQANGKIKVNQKFQTAVEHIYAIGDVIDGAMLAHKAMDEGEAVGDIVAGKASQVFYEGIPSVVYTAPELAWVGKSEEDLKQNKIPYITGKSYVRGSGRARAMEENEGMVKIIAHKDSRQILSGFLLAANASEMLAQVTLAVKQKLTIEQLASLTQAHPTISELVKEAALNALGRSIHV